MQTRSRGLRELCRLLGYSAQAYYQYQHQTEKRIVTQEALVQQIQEHRRLQPRIGARKLLELTQPNIGRDAFFELLRHNGLLLRTRRYRVRTTFSSHRFRKYPDLTKCLVPQRPDQLWVSDITYLRIKQDFAYLSLVTDAYSRKIIGFSVSHDLSTDSCLKALRMAFKGKLGDQPLIHHSDRGTQYCSKAYTKLLKRKSVAISMTESGNPRDNAVAERVNGILKMELLKENYDNIDIAHKSIKQAVQIYNALRPHSSIICSPPK
jgi:putative transposase